jgi:2-keto-4-pentenoate hydratase/2-oxohepta-3-ene-1,7-dioic acid hydratase in catechol pathway
MAGAVPLQVHGGLIRGLAMKPPQFLPFGDVATLGIEGLGEQKPKIVAPKK